MPLQQKRAHQAPVLTVEPGSARHALRGSAQARERGAAGQRLPQLLVGQAQQAQQLPSWPAGEGPRAGTQFTCARGRRGVDRGWWGL